MITVTIDGVELIQRYPLSELLGKSSSKNAFIGRCGNGPEASLYIIGLTGIFLAEDPRRFWNAPNCEVVVAKFVDLVITVKGASIVKQEVVESAIAKSLNTMLRDFTCIQDGNVVFDGVRSVQINDKIVHQMTIVEKR